MANIWLFQAELKRYFSERWSHFGNFASALFIAVVLFGTIVVILNGITGGNFGKDQQLLVMVGWLAWLIASDCMNEIAWLIVDEAETGTLEQLCLSPIPLLRLLIIRSFAYFLGSVVQNVGIALVLFLIVKPVLPTPTLVALLLVSLAGVYGVGFIFAGLALVLKRTSSLFNLVFSLMIFTSGAFIGLEKLGRFFDVMRLIFPMTWGISLMRASLLGKALSGGDFLGLGLHSAAFLIIGLGVYAWAYRTAREQGTLAHY